MSLDLEPRAEKRRTRDGSGPRWDVIRGDVLERDGYACQRCGYEASVGDPDQELEVHNTEALGSPSLGDLDGLVTLCRPCHATLHGDDPAYGDLGDDAPMFPRPEAPPAVATMRSERQHVCERCQLVADEAGELAAYTGADRPHVLCKPCAGALLEVGYGPDAFETAGRFDAGALRARAGDAPVRPSLLASGPVRATRPPETAIERFVHDTPIRYVANPIGVTVLFVLLGVLASFYLL